MLKRLARILGLLILLVALFGSTVAWLCLRPLPMIHPTVDFDIDAGMSMRRIATRVADAGIEVSPILLTSLARISGHAVRIKAGSYRIDRPVSMWELMTLMSTGANTYSDITFIEGWTFDKLREVMASHPDLRHDTKGLDDAEIMRRLGLGDQAPEGMFAPDTYSFSRGASELDLLRRAHAHMTRMLDDLWQRRAEDLPLKTPYEALILASIVEKETGRAADRPLIASVFVNRLRLGMPLQSDPTVIYGLGRAFDGNLRRRDLKADTPYNSYTRSGLPPTPIALPGKGALEATLNPARSDNLYFVARGDGSSVFSRTLDEHNRAVARYQRTDRK